MKTLSAAHGRKSQGSDPRPRRSLLDVLLPDHVRVAVRRALLGQRQQHQDHRRLRGPGQQRRHRPRSGRISRPTPRSWCSRTDRSRPKRPPCRTATSRPSSSSRRVSARPPSPDQRRVADSRSFSSTPIHRRPRRPRSSSRRRQRRSPAAISFSVASGGKPPILTRRHARSTLTSTNVSTVTYLVPSILAMALMQLGVFAAVPLVQQREKGILKRIGATPLQRWKLVGSNILLRLIVAAVDTVLIIGVGHSRLQHPDRRQHRSLAAGFVFLGAGAFLALGFMLASFLKTEEQATAWSRSSRCRSCSCRASSSRSRSCPTSCAPWRASAAHLSGRRPAPEHGQRPADCPAGGGRRDPGRLARGLPGHRRALVPLGVGERPAQVEEAPARPLGRWPVRAGSLSLATSVRDGRWPRAASSRRRASSR